MKLHSLASLKKKELETIVVSELPQEIKMTSYARKKAYAVNKLIKEMFGSSLEWYGFLLAKKEEPELIVDIGIGKNNANQSAYTGIDAKDIDDFLRTQAEGTIINGWIHSHGNLGFHNFSGTDERNHKTVLDFVAGCTAREIGYAEILVKNLVVTTAEEASSKINGATLAIITNSPVESAKIMEKIEGSFSYSIVVDDSGWHEQEIHFMKTKPLSKTMEISNIRAQISEVLSEKEFREADIAMLKSELERKISRQWYWWERGRKAEKAGVLIAKKPKLAGEEVYEQFKATKAWDLKIYLNEKNRDLVNTDSAERKQPEKEQAEKPENKATLLGLVGFGLKIIYQEVVRAITPKYETRHNNTQKLGPEPVNTTDLEPINATEPVNVNYTEATHLQQNEQGYSGLNTAGYLCQGGQETRGENTLRSQNKSRKKSAIENIIAGCKWKPYKDYTINGEEYTNEGHTKFQIAENKSYTQGRTGFQSPRTPPENVRTYARNLVERKVHRVEELPEETGRAENGVPHKKDRIERYDPTQDNIQ